MNCTEIIKKYLSENGYDGLHSDECGCLIDDLAPCGGYFSLCEPGYKVVHPDGENHDGYDFWVCSNRDGMPWE